MRQDWMIVAAVAVAVGATGWAVMRPAGSGAGSAEERLLVLRNNRYAAGGWTAAGSGSVTLDSTAGVATLAGPVLWWLADREFGDGTLELDYRRTDSTAVGGVYLRLPATPGEDYGAHAFAIRLGPDSAGVEANGAVAGVRAPSAVAGASSGGWHHLSARFDGTHLRVAIDDTTIMDWTAAPEGPVRDALPRGHLGLESRTGVIEVRNIVAGTP